MTKKRRSSDDETPSNSETSGGSSVGDKYNNVPKRRRISSFESTMSRVNVRVVARLRPLSSKEKAEQSKPILRAVIGNNSILDTVSNNNRSYQYDAVFGPQDTQTEVYQKTAGDIIQSGIFQGFNVTVLAYGQTGAGKTYTMGTATTFSGPQNELPQPAEMDGIIPRAVYDLFRTRQQMTNGVDRVNVELSYLEIYNEEARDLLAAGGDGTNLHIRDSKTEGVVVQGLTWISVESPGDVHSRIESAAERRVTASTQMNAVSSRSHAICTLRVTIAPSEEDSPDSHETTAKLTLVDLAGSERIKRTGAEGDRMKEGININKGLFVLGQVVSCLSEKSGTSGFNNSMHVPYRDSKLTRLLQDSLGGNSRTIMIACVSPAESNAEESINTLRYAQRARNIQNEATKNVLDTTGLSPQQAAELRRENQLLKMKVTQLQSRLVGLSSSTQSASITSLPGDATETVESTSAIEGVGLENLETISRLRANSAALQTRVDQLEDLVRSSSEDSLEASLKADRAQLKLEELKALAKSQGVHLEQTELQQIGLVEKQRKEIQELKQLLKEERLDCEVARATAASIITSGGNLSKAEEVALARDVNESDGIKNNGEHLSAQLVAVSGDIEMKEDLVRKAMKERECMEAMRSHFESSLKALQNEVTVLSMERERLLGDISDIGPKSQSNETKKMQKRIKDLEIRIQNLRSKAEEHKKTLRLREMAEKKCAQLTAEIHADKKRRTALQKKLKAESEDRRNERKAAKIQATKLMRDSQKLKMELQKVRTAAERQAAVLRRKAAEAINKQKRLAEQQRKRSKATGVGNRTGKGKSERMEEREGEIFAWFHNEFEAALTIVNSQEQIEEQELLLDDLLHKIREVGDSDPANRRSLELEAESRRTILTQLHKNAEDYKRSLGLSKLSRFHDMSTWNHMAIPEMKSLFINVFDQFVNLRTESDKAAKNHQSDVAKAVAAAVSEERQRADEAIMLAKLEQSEEVALLLDSTRNAIENSVTVKSAPELVDKGKVEKALGDYMNKCSVIGDRVKGQLKDLKSQRNAMTSMMHEVASEIAMKTQATIEKATTTNNKKKNKSKKRLSEDRVSEIFIFEEDEADAVEVDDNDSDWSPDYTPARKKHKAVLSTQDEQQDDSDNQLVKSTTNPRQDSSSSYKSKKVSELRALLRERGLKVSGKKQELVERLVSHEASAEDKSNDRHVTASLKNDQQEKENKTQTLTSAHRGLRENRKSLTVLKAQDANTSNGTHDGLSRSEEGRHLQPMLLTVSAKKRKRRSMVDAVNTAMQALSGLDDI